MYYYTFTPSHVKGDVYRITVLLKVEWIVATTFETHIIIIILIVGVLFQWWLRSNFDFEMHS